MNLKVEQNFALIKSAVILKNINFYD